MANQDLSVEQRAMKGAAMMPEERKSMWLSISDITEAEFDAYHVWREERQARVPQPGSPAPDFELDRLGTDGTRGGERVRLSAQRGTPVALVFGSYT